MKTSSWEVDTQKFLSPSDVKTLLDATRKTAAEGNPFAVRDLFFLRLGLATGLRVMEIAALNCGDFNLNDTMPSLVVLRGKGKKKRRVFFSHAFKRQCEGYFLWKKTLGESVEPDQPLLLSSSTEGHLTTRALQKAFKRCARRAGLPPRYSIHCLRHTYACFLLKASNWNLRLVQKQLGHSKITTTQVYADVMMPEIKNALENLDSNYQ